jgi:hypothetical protein
LALPPSELPKTGSGSTADTLQQDVFLREVDDALRQDEMVNAFKRHGKTAGLAVALGLAALAGYLWWDKTSNESVAANSERYAIALDKVEAGQLDSGRTQLGPLTKDGSGSGVAARLLAAGILQEQGKAEEAARGFAAVAADSSAPQPFRDLALIRETAIRFDKLQPQQVIDRLKPLAVAGKPWFGSAAEMTAMAYLRMDKGAQAGPLFAQIAKDASVPESLRNRALQMAGLLGVDAIDDVARAAGIENDSAWAASQQRPPAPQPQQAPPPASK